MARKDEKLNYPAAVRELKAAGAKKLYFLWGPEDYLREQYLLQLKALCLPEGEDGFSFHRINGPELDMDIFRQAVDAVPFLSERSFVELREIDINRIKDNDGFIKCIRDIPDYCTVCFVQGAQFEPDGRLKAVKALREEAKELVFTQQSQGMLTDWIVRRFAHAGKSIELDAAQRLIYISGDLMNRLIPEIEKVAAFAKGERVTVSDVEAVASHIPEAVVFDMTDRIAEKKYNAAMSILSELLADKNNDPIMLLAILGMQMRRLYAAKLIVKQGAGVKELMELCAIKYEFIASKLISAAKGYTPEQLIRAVELCAEADYKMKSSSVDDTELLKETVLRIVAGESVE